MRRREGPRKKSLAASMGVHAVAVAVAWFAQASPPRPLDFITYQVEIVSPPPAREAEIVQPVQEEELMVETPDPTPLQEEPEPPPVLEEDPVREEVRPEATPTPPPPEPEPVEDAGDPDPSDQPSGEDLNVRMEGLARDFPVYYQNIIRQMGRCMRFTGPGGLKTSVFFTINRDGSVDGDRIEFVTRSGNAGFDFAVMGAVECAGAGRFGALPEELGFDRFPIIFEVTSARRGPDRDGPGDGLAPMHPRDR
jgi:hypothetical protein